jgi:hypothetical protein
VTDPPRSEIRLTTATSIPTAAATPEVADDESAAANGVACPAATTDNGPLTDTIPNGTADVVVDTSTFNAIDAAAPTADATPATFGASANGNDGNPGNWNPDGNGNTDDEPGNNDDEPGNGKPPNKPDATPNQPCDCESVDGQPDTGHPAVVTPPDDANAFANESGDPTACTTNDPADTPATDVATVVSTANVNATGPANDAVDDDRASAVECVVAIGVANTATAPVDGVDTDPPIKPAIVVFTATDTDTAAEIAAVPAVAPGDADDTVVYTGLAIRANPAGNANQLGRSDEPTNTFAAFNVPDDTANVVFTANTNEIVAPTPPPDADAVDTGKL